MKFLTSNSFELPSSLNTEVGGGGALVVFQGHCMSLFDELSQSAMNLEKIEGAKRHAGGVCLQWRVGFTLCATMI